MKSPHRQTSNRSRSTQGVVLIETALTITLILFVFLGIFQIGLLADRKQRAEMALAFAARAWIAADDPNVLNDLSTHVITDYLPTPDNAELTVESPVDDTIVSVTSARPISFLNFPGIAEAFDGQTLDGLSTVSASVTLP